MINFTDVALVIFAIAIAPFIGGLLSGIDRKLTARLQNRIGPPIMQPFYDVAKLFSKKRIVVNRLQLICEWAYLILIVLSLVMLVLKQDLLVIIFILATGCIFFILAGFSVKSPYSQMGSQREVLQMLSYEPLLIFFMVGIYLKTKSFAISEIFTLKEPLLYSMPLLLVGMMIVMLIKLRKSPFDISTSHHAHQELVKGITTEFSGPYLGFIEVTHWYELVLLLGFVSLLWAPNLIVGIILSLVCYFIIIVIDNISARLTWSWMLKFTWTTGLALALINIVYLYFVTR